MQLEDNESCEIYVFLKNICHVKIKINNSGTQINKCFEYIFHNENAYPYDNCMYGGGCEIYICY